MKSVAVSGGNAKRVLFGTINIATGHRLFLARRRQRAEDQQAFLEHIHRHYRGWHVPLLLDEDSSHTAGGSVDWAERYGMALLWLPKRAPKLNPMDTLWGQGKDVISANKQYATIEEQVDRFLDYLRGLTKQEALHTSGVLSKKFWLKRALSNYFCGLA